MEVKVRDDKLEITDSEGMSVRLDINEVSELVKYLKIKLR